MTSPFKNVEQSFALAKERYAGLGVDVDKALERLAKIPISLHCWQGDDVGGFENAGLELGGGLALIAVALVIAALQRSALEG